MPLLIFKILGFLKNYWPYVLMGGAIAALFVLWKLALLDVKSAEADVKKAKAESAIYEEQVKTYQSQVSELNSRINTLSLTNRKNQEAMDAYVARIEAIQMEAAKQAEENRARDTSYQKIIKDLKNAKSQEVPLGKFTSDVGLKRLLCLQEHRGSVAACSSL